MINQRTLYHLRSAAATCQEERCTKRKKMKATSQSKNSISSVKVPVGSKRLDKIDQLMSLLPLGFYNTKPVVAVMRLEGVIGKAGAMKPGLTISSLNIFIM